MEEASQNTNFFIPKTKHGFWNECSEFKTTKETKLKTLKTDSFLIQVWVCIHTQKKPRLLIGYLKYIKNVSVLKQAIFWIKLLVGSVSKKVHQLK